jgi:putative NADH-flavin reductase
MNLIIFGASGQLGKILVKQALERGHQVTAFARRPEDLALQSPRLALARGDVLDGASLLAALADQEAAISVLGIRRGAGGLLLAEGMANLVQACQAAGVKRFICLSSLGVGPSRGRLGWLHRTVFAPLLLRTRLAELEVLEGYIRASALDWTIVQTGRLAGGRRSGRYRVCLSVEDRGGIPHISSEDVASFLLDELESSQFPRQTVGVRSLRPNMLKSI